MLEMELNLLLDILKIGVPTVIALASLIYVIKQRNVVKSALSKKRYLESALSNLNGAIESLRNINITHNLNSIESYEVWGDTTNDVVSLVADILRASFNLKTKNIVLDVSYYAEGQRKEQTGFTSTFKGGGEGFFGVEEAQTFVDTLRTYSVRIDSKTSIANFERFWRGNDLSFSILMSGFEELKEAKEKLLAYEEVYESLCPHVIRKLNQIIDNIAEGILEAIRKSKHIELDLQEFSEVRGIMIYLLEEILQYSKIAKEFSEVSELISELTEARKELFLKIS